MDFGWFWMVCLLRRGVEVFFCGVFGWWFVVKKG